MTERGIFQTRRFLVGQAGPFPRIVFREEVMAEIDEFARNHPTGEHGGFLIGRKRNIKSLEEYEVIVDRFVPLTEQTGGSRFVISKAHWNSVVRSLQQAGNNERIVGWIHTHPGFGAFLSAFDREQHKRFFSKPWQVAYVVDLQNDARSVFCCTENDWKELGGYYILRQVIEGNPIASVRTKIHWPRLAAVLAIVGLLIGGGVFGYTWMAKQGGTEQAALDESSIQVQYISGADEPVVDVNPIPEPDSGSNGQEAVSIPSYANYIVQDGDSLWSIAAKLWGDATLFRELAEFNGIDDPSKITAGVMLRIPNQPPGQ